MNACSRQAYWEDYPSHEHRSDSPVISLRPRDKIWKPAGRDDVLHAGTKIGSQWTIFNSAPIGFIGFMDSGLSKKQSVHVNCHGRRQGGGLGA